MGTPTMCINFSCISKKVQTRRNFLSAAFMAVVLKTHSAKATYGDSANVFGKITNKSGFVAFAGDGFSLLLPSKWNPSKEKDFPSVALRYEDNFDAVNNLVVIKEKTDKNRIDDFGTPEQFLNSVSGMNYNKFYVLHGSFSSSRFYLVNNHTLGKQYRKVDLHQIEYLLRQF